MPRRRDFGRRERRAGYFLFTSQSAAGLTLDGTMATIFRAPGGSQTTSGGEPSGNQPQIEPVTAPQVAARPGGVRQLAVGSDRCPRCAAEMAPDQRYCIECGTRRGQPKFTLAPATRGAQADTGGPADPGVGRRSEQPTSGGWSSGVGLVLTIAVLLLALGVGYQIGHGNSGSGKNVVLDEGAAASNTAGTGSGSGSGSASANNASTSSSGSGSSSKASSTAVTSAPTAKVGADAPKSKAAQAAARAHPSKAVQQAASNAAKAVTKGTAKLASPTTKPGGSCTAGTVGCQGGKFTGNAFGGG